MLDEVIAQLSLLVFFIDESLWNDGVALFLHVNKQGSSITACAHVALISYFAISSIFSFANVYRTEFAIPNAPKDVKTECYPQNLRFNSGFRFRAKNYPLLIVSGLFGAIFEVLERF